MGKYGGEELTFGSDLDLLILGDANEPETLQKCAEMQKIIGYRQSAGVTYELDFRLRPYGNDGPLILTLSAFDHYHKHAGQLWERQMLTRSRIVAGSPGLTEAFIQMRDALLYKSGLSVEDIQLIRQMRETIQREKAPHSDRETNFKTGPGGLVDIEFLCQATQLAYGHRYPSLCQPDTRSVLERLRPIALFPEASLAQLIENQAFLNTVQLYLRRDENRSLNTFSFESQQEEALARWLGFSGVSDFRKRYLACLKDNASTIEALWQQLSAALQG